MITTYVINLDKDAEKFRRVADAFPWELTRLPAVDGAKAPGRPFLCGKNAYGCLLSHRKAWRMVVASGSPALILEDNCHPVDGFETRFAQLLKTLPPGFDVALFGYTASDIAGHHLATAVVAPVMKRRPTRKINEDWLVPGIFVGAFCYLVSPQGARKLLDDKTSFHADAVMCRNTKLKLYCVKEPIATHHRHKKPVGTLGDRFGHVALLYMVVVFMLAASKNPIARVSSRVLIVAPVIHYLNTRAHVSHNLLHMTEKEPGTERSELLRKLNDLLNYATLVLLAAVSASKGVLIQMVDLYLLAQLTRAAIIAAGKPMPDPSGTCEERSIRRYSLFENCGALRVSGHIMGAVFLSFLTPRVGLPLVALQAALILSSKSHYPGDVALGVLVASAWAIQKK